MAMKHDDKMLDRPWLARHAMARHKWDFERFRLAHLRSFEVKQALAEAIQLRDAGLDTTDAIAKLEAAKARGDVDAIVTSPTHERLINRPKVSEVDEVFVMRAMRDDRIRRDLQMVFKQQSRLISYGAIVMSLMVAWAGLGWAWSHTDSLRASYQAAILDYQNAQPKSLRQKAQELAGFGKRLADEKKQQMEQKLDERRDRNAQKEGDVIDEIRRKRGE
jgi:hypothetical protein